MITFLKIHPLKEKKNQKIDIITYLMNIYCSKEKILIWNELKCKWKFIDLYIQSYYFKKFRTKDERQCCKSYYSLENMES